MDKAPTNSPLRLSDGQTIITNPAWLAWFENLTNGLDTRQGDEVADNALDWTMPIDDEEPLQSPDLQLQSLITDLTQMVELMQQEMAELILQFAPMIDIDPGEVGLGSLRRSL